MNVYYIVIIYFLLMNCIGFILMGVDKYKARRNMWRIPEATLFLFAILGGSVGSILGMFLFHHKTRHWYFRYGLPLILLMQVFLYVLFTKMPIQIAIQ